jgi:hypothetical protein
MKTLTPPEIAKALALISFSAFSVLAVAPAQAIVLDFESLAVNDNNFHLHGNTYTEDGFTISSAGTQLVTWGTQTSLSPGSTALFDNAGFQSVTLSQVGGSAFTLSSIDLADVYNSPTQVTVNFIGTRADSSTVSQSFTTDSILGLETFAFSNFTNLVSVNWQNNSSNWNQFDNIVINGAPTAAVPEPFTIVGTIIGGTAALRMKKKLKSNK